MLNKRILFFGFFSFGKPVFNGQSFRSKNLKILFSDYLNYSVDCSDTVTIRESPFKFLKNILSIPKYHFILVSLAHNGVKFLFPIIFLVSKIFNKKIYFVALGGWLPSMLSKNNFLKKIYRDIDLLFVQSEILKDELESVLVSSNVRVLPNFKQISFNRSGFSKASNRFRIVFLSLICKAKGIDTVYFLAEQIESSSSDILIDMYGPIDSEFSNYLADMEKRFSFVNYKGVLDQAEVHTVLSNYDLMLFPTHHKTEGFPGVILDAFIVGLPILTSNWNLSREFIEDSFGFIYDDEDPYKAFEWILWLTSNLDLLEKMKMASYDNRNKYSIDKIADQLRQLGF